MKYKSLVIFFWYFGYTLKTKCRNVAIFFFPFLHPRPFPFTSGDWETPKITWVFEFLKFEFRQLKKEKKKAD